MNTTHSARARRTEHRALFVGAAVAAALALSACGSGVSAAPQPTAGATGAVTIENCGRELVFDAPPTRVVGMMPSQTELLIRLGLADTLVGQAQTTTFALPSDIAVEAEQVPVLSTDLPPAREDLLTVAPQLVVAPTEYEFTAEQGFASIEQLAETGAAAYVATGGCAERRNTAKVEDLLTDIDNLGVIFGVEEAADDLRASAEQRLAAVAAAIEGQSRPTVAQLFIDGSSLGVIGAGVEADIIATAGGDNVFEPDEPAFANFFAATVAPEELTSRDPDVIVLGVRGEDDERLSRDYLERTFPTVTAVREDRIVAVPASDLYPGTMGNVGAVELIAAALHPAAG
jgi:iron complex transport system substrate-binding protein